MDSLKNIVSLTKYKRKEKKTNGATYRWQDRAVIVWQKLGLTGSPKSGFFKIFRDDPQKAEQCYSFVVDASAYDPEKLFYWKYNDLKRVQK